MGFSIYCIIESGVFAANAVAILNDRFLIPYKLSINNINHNTQDQNNQTPQGPDEVATVPFNSSQG